MSDYSDLVKKEAKAFYDQNAKTFSEDSNEFGGKSKNPSFGRWVDKSGGLAARVTEISAKWGQKEIHWVQAHTKNKPTPGGDPRSNAFGSFLKDIRHELKRLSKS